MTLKLAVPPNWNVEIRPHTIANGRWSIPNTNITLPAEGELGAMLQAIIWTQANLGIPPWIPYRMQSLPYATATEAKDKRESPMDAATVISLEERPAA